MHPLTESWWQVFINRTDGTLRQGGDGWRYTPKELTRAELDAALNQRQSLGVYTVDVEGLSRWLCLDADTQESKAGLVALAEELDPTSSLFELSRRGAHLWWLCPPTPWQHVRAVGRALIAECGLDCEVFPKSAGRNGVRLPLTRHPQSGLVYPIIDPGTGEVRDTRELAMLRRQALPAVSMPPEPVGPPSRCKSTHGSFTDLWREMEAVTSLRQYGPERAIGRCPFHDDRRPSLSLLGGFWRCWAGCGEGGIGAFRAVRNSRGRR